MIQWWYYEFFLNSLYLKFILSNVFQKCPFNIYIYIYIYWNIVWDTFFFSSIVNFKHILTIACIPKSRSPP
ncbi:MAG: hypothetical protein N7Q72_04435, partial [Spiroplasma sp. Tabriz.8]|nr:hypothetical protein [Spiroplasma sp. Tabriz.8]